MEVLAEIAKIVSPLIGAAAVLYFQGRHFSIQDAKLNKIERRMDCFESSQHTCQLENLQRFAMKEDLHEIERDVDGLKTRVTRLEGRAA